MWIVQIADDRKAERFSADFRPNEIGIAGLGVRGLMLICRPTADHFIESGQALRLHDEGEITWSCPPQT